MRNFTVIDAPQRSEAWRAARAGRLTGSKADCILAEGKSGELAKRRDYRWQLVCERLTGQPQDSEYVNDDMRRGVELEPLARAAYEEHTGTVVRETGFLSHVALMAGTSLDGHLGDFEGLLECKAPRAANHIRYLRDGVVPVEHRPQLWHALWLTDAAWIDFVSFCPQLPEGLQLFVVRMERDRSGMETYDKKARAFLAEVEAEVDALQTARNLRGTLERAAAL
jgi:hypothetical protein